jgi:hypothetical protein
MPAKASGQITATVGGRYYSMDVTASGDSSGSTSPTLAAAKTGALTTRTDNDTGTITGASGHGISTADRIDIYWDGGSRRHVLVGTVSGLSIPFGASGGEGLGDNLPAADTALTFMKENVEVHTFSGDDLIGLGVNSPSYPATVVFRQSDLTEIFAIELDAGESYVWTSAMGVDNPLAGGSVGKISITHAGSAGPSDITVDYVRA